MTTGTANRIAKAIKNIEPDVVAAGTVNGPAIDCRQFGQLLVLLQTGTLGSSATVDCKVQEAVDSAFTIPIDVTGAAFTQVTQAGTDGSDKVYQGSVGCKDRLRYMRTVLVVAVATSDVAVGAVLLDPQEAEITPTESETFTVA